MYNLARSTNAGWAGALTALGAALFMLLGAAACDGDNGNGDTGTDVVGEETPDVQPDETTDDVPADNLVDVDWVDEPCPGTWIELTHAPTDLILMVNRSSTLLLPADGHDPTAGEMGTCADENFGPASGITYATRWEEVALAVGDGVEDNQDRINQGLMLYPGPGLVGSGTVNIEQFCEGSITNPVTQVDPGLNTAAAIQSELVSADNFPICDVGMSNLRQGLENVANVLSMSDPGPDVIVVVTGSGPNCNLSMPRCSEAECTYDLQYCDGSSGTIGCLDDVTTEAELASLLSDGIRTDVVGVPGSDGYADVFDGLAAAGGTTSHHAAAEATDITTAIEEIAASEVSCVFELSAAGDATDVNVLVDGAPLVRDDANGFSYDATERSVTLLGTACDGFLAGSVTQVQFLSGCPAFGG
jgi:hypothetical protein